jgi:hypothetical protein
MEIAMLVPFGLYVALLGTIRPDASRIVLPGVGHEVILTASAQRPIAGWLQEQGIARRNSPVPSASSSSSSAK